MVRTSRPARGPALGPIALHYAYFLALTLTFTLLFHASGTTSHPDSLFLVVSALTSTGLTTLPLSSLSTPQQALLCALMVLGSAMWVSFMMLSRKKRALERQGVRGRARGYSAAAAWGKEKADPGLVVEGEAVGLGSGASLFSGSLVATHGHHGAAPRPPSLVSLPDAPLPEEGYAVKLLSRLVPLYALLWLLGAARVLAGRGVPPWAALFLATSAFTNCGMALHDENLEPFQRSYVVLFLAGGLVLAGNTAFPAFLRLMLWCARGLTPRRIMGRQKSALASVLRSPRRMYTHLFPARQTWWLVAMLVATTGVDWVAFEVMSFGNPALERIPLGSRILDGLFQAISVRGAGFHVVPVAQLYPGLRLLYMLMMYLSAFPIVIAMRNSSPPDLRDVTLGHPGRRPPPLTRLRRLLTPGDSGSAIARQVRAEMLRDAALLPLAIFFIVLLERGGRSEVPAPADLEASIFAGAHLLKDFPAPRVFDVAFEVISAYGCVGMSVGSFRGPASLCADWGVWSKLVLVGIMMRGRHRGLGVILGGG